MNPKFFGINKTFWLAVLLFVSAGSLLAQEIPAPYGWVNDYANVISPDFKEKITRVISELEEKTSSEIAVVTILSIAPYSEIDYARKLFDTWKPGKKGKDNGVLVLLAVKERRWRIETGYGVEGVLPDGLCGEIGRNYMVPYFKAGKYSEGLFYGVSEIAGILGGNSPQPQKRLKIPIPQSDEAIFIIICIWIFLVLMLSNSSSSRGGWYGSSGSGGGGFSGGGFGGFGGGGGGGGGAGGGF